MKQAILGRVVVPRLRCDRFRLLVAILFCVGANGAAGRSFATSPITLVMGSEPGSTGYTPAPGAKAQLFKY